ncbi:hypothetical protein CRYUN_Cryun25bG0009200 [Craigia yunnanensis]
MQAVWVSLKENVNCVSKLTDVVGRPENNCRKKGYDSINENLKKELVHQLRNPFREALVRPNYPRTVLWQVFARISYNICFFKAYIFSLQRFSAI